SKPRNCPSSPGGAISCTLQEARDTCSPSCFPAHVAPSAESARAPRGKNAATPPSPQRSECRAKLAIRGPRATRKRELGAQSAYLKQGHDVRRPQRQSSEGPAGHEHGASASRHSRSQRRGRQRSAPSAAAPVRHAVQRPSRPFAALGSTGRCGTRNRCPATQRRSADAAPRTQSPERAQGPKVAPPPAQSLRGIILNLGRSFIRDGLSIGGATSAWD
ncbi:unnamed protein product, partial [Ixodes pacificus]